PTCEFSSDWQEVNPIIAVKAIADIIFIVFMLLNFRCFVCYFYP
ncbi:MAG: hypothetical protein ACI9Z4_000627, partial [Polaribacter sp.]